MVTTCAETREHAAELVLGTLDGETRAAVVAHLASCAECRDEVASLARVADTLWLSAPEAEPPAGFETKVLRAVRPRRRYVTPVRLLGVAAALVLLLAGVVAGSARVRGPERSAGVMRDRTSAVVGHAVVAGGDQAYVYVSVDDWGDSGDYVVEVVRRDGSHVAVAPIHIARGRGSAGAPLPVPYGDVRAVWVTDPGHAEWCAYRL